MAWNCSRIGFIVSALRRAIGRCGTSFTMVCDIFFLNINFILILCQFFSALILFSVCGLLAVTGSWLMSGIYLSSSVAVSDLCMDPADYLVSEAPSELPTEVLLYYTQCESARSNPFTQRLREASNAIINARSAMNVVSK